MTFLQNKKFKVFAILLVLFLVWRLFLFIPVFVSQQVLQYREGYSYTRVLFFNPHPEKLVNNPLISSWANFDGVAYLSTAGSGYVRENARFFPLFPIVISTISKVFGNVKAFDLVQVIIAFFVSNILFFCSLIMFYKLIRLDFSQKIAFLSTVFLLIFPTSFFFGSIYTESLFLFLSLCSFYFARKKMWVLASISGILLSATRIVGVFILPALLWEFFLSRHPGGQSPIGSQKVQEKQKDSIALLQNDTYKLVPILLVPIGLISFMYFNYVNWKDPLLFLHQQGEVLNGRTSSSIIFIGQTLFRYLKIITTVSPLVHFEWWIALLELMSFIFATIMIYIAWVKKIRVSYILFSLFCFLPPVFSGTFTGLPRYVLILFPMFISIALIKNKFVQVSYVIISIILLFILTMFFSRGYLIA